MNDLFDFDMERLSQTLITHSKLFKCSLEEAWNEHISAFIKNYTTLEEVKNYIENKNK